jgi:hypothetical protein
VTSLWLENQNDSRFVAVAIAIFMIATLKPMRASYLFALSALFLLFMSCDYDIEECQYSACTRDFVKGSNMDIYCDQEIGCNAFIIEYRLGGIEYFLVEHPCVDMWPVPVFDCQRNIICGVIDGCSWFFTQAEYVGIVGVRKK